jgi:hypothetical protein
MDALYIARSYLLSTVMPDRHFRPRGCPVQPDRCQWVCRGRAQSRVALALSRRDATAGSALDGVLPRRKDRRHPLDGSPALIGLARCRRPRNGEQPPACGKRVQPRASAAAPGSAVAREGEAQPTLWRGQAPAHSPAEVLALVVMLALPDASISGTPRLQLSGLCAGSARAWREPQASALKP